MRSETQLAFAENRKVLVSLTQMVQSLQKGKDPDPEIVIIRNYKDTFGKPKTEGGSSNEESSFNSPYWSKLLPKVDLPMFEGDDPRL